MLRYLRSILMCWLAQIDTLVGPLKTYTALDKRSETERKDRGSGGTGEGRVCLLPTAVCARQRVRVHAEGPNLQGWL